MSSIAVSQCDLWCCQAFRFSWSAAYASPLQVSHETTNHAHDDLTNQFNVRNTEFLQYFAGKADTKRILQWIRRLPKFFDTGSAAASLPSSADVVKKEQNAEKKTQDNGYSPTWKNGLSAQKDGVTPRFKRSTVTILLCYQRDLQQLKQQLEAS